MNLDDGKRRPHAVNTSSGSTGRLVLVSVAKMICEVDLYTPISASSNTGISFRSFFGRVTAMDESLDDDEDESSELDEDSDSGSATGTCPLRASGVRGLQCFLTEATI